MLEEKKLRGTLLMDSDTRKRVAKEGGLTISQNRWHMAEIGRKGGLSVSQNRSHMSEIGRRGGLTTAARKRIAHELKKEKL